MRAVLALAAAQHGVVTRAQLRDRGVSGHAIKHRIERGRLFVIFRGVYAVGTPHLTRNGRWMAAVLAGGEAALLSHRSAAALWGILEREEPGAIEISVPARRNPRVPGVRVHRRSGLEGAAASRERVPVTSIVVTIIDLAPILDPDRLEAAVNAADRARLIDPESLRGALPRYGNRPGVALVAAILDRRTFTRSDSWLERRFRPIWQRAGLEPPLTQQWVNGGRVDFYWPGLGLVVETDGLRYHRTPAQQAVDRRRDQAHTASGLTALRFTYEQIARAPAEVEAVLRATAKRLTQTPPD